MLFGKKDLLRELPPFMVGGETVSETTYTTADFEPAPHKYEAGLQNYAGIMGFAAAVEYLKKIGFNNLASHELKLNKTITESFLELGIDIIGPEDPAQRSGIVSFNIGKKDPHEIALMLDSSAKIMTRSGAFCVHSWFNAHNMVGSVRASSYVYNTEEECERLVKEVKKIIQLK
jgi:cysteine desulfurase/selenocysteine lyase